MVCKGRPPLQLPFPIEGNLFLMVYLLGSTPQTVFELGCFVAGNVSLYFKLLKSLNKVASADADFILGIATFTLCQNAVIE